MAHVRSEIVRIYGSQIDSEFLSRAPHRPLIQVLDKLHPRGEALSIFTTNYDPILEQVFEEWGTAPLPSGNTPRVCTGFTNRRPGQWQPGLFSSRPAPDQRLIHLVKLHGSATWKMGPTGPVETGWGRPTPQDCLLYFGYKSVPETEPYITLHAQLKRALLKSEAMVVVGFRFGDPYIRELFDFALQANPMLRVVCSLTRTPETNSPLAQMIESFPGRVILLADADGNSIPFGHSGFEDTLERTLQNTRQADATA